MTYFHVLKNHVINISKIIHFNWLNFRVFLYSMISYIHYCFTSGSWCCNLIYLLSVLNCSTLSHDVYFLVHSFFLTCHGHLHMLINMHCPFKMNKQISRFKPAIAIFTAPFDIWQEHCFLFIISAWFKKTTTPWIWAVCTFSLFLPDNNSVMTGSRFSADLEWGRRICPEDGNGQGELGSQGWYTNQY